MPQDTTLKNLQVSKDTVKKIVIIKEDKPFFFDGLKDQLTSGFFGWLVTIILTFLLAGMRLKKIWEKSKIRFQSSAEKIDFTDDDIKESSKFFIASEIWVNNRKDETIENIEKFVEKIIYRPENKNPLQVKYENKGFMITGSTGIGKTTYLCNLYNYYAEYSKRKDAPKLLLGKMHSSSTIRKIEELKKTNECENTILLLDAVDEYISNDVKTRSSIDAYEKDFLNFWKENEEKYYRHFLKVIFTIREQFYNKILSLADRDNIDENGINFLNVDGKPITRLYIQGFDSFNIHEYIEKRHVNDKVTQSRMKEFWAILSEHFEGTSEIFKAPLLLNYLEDIEIAQTEKRLYSLDRFNIYTIIVNNWLQREADKYASPDYKQSLKEFCIHLAYKMYLDNIKHFHLSDLKEFEKSIGRSIQLHFEKGFSDRSLLRRNKENDRIEFVHSSFLDYFLAEYEISNSNKIQFQSYNFGARLFIEKKWDEKRNEIPKINDLQIWADFLDCFTNNETIRREMPQVINNLIISSNELYFQDLSFAVDNEIWDEENEYVKPEFALAIKCLKHYINDISLEEISLTDEDFSIFNGVDCLKKLKLKNIFFWGGLLKYFSNCVNSLELLNLTNNSLLADEHLVFFKGANKIEHLFLSQNNLTGHGLQYFRKSITCLYELELNENQISDHYLSAFDGADKIQSLHLIKNKIKGEGFIYFKKSTTSLRRLALNQNPIIESFLIAFEGVDKLKALHLNRVNLKGDGLQYFKKSATSLIILDLSGNQITDEYLVAFEGADKIVELALGENNLCGQGLNYFKKSVTSLKRLGIVENQITDEHLVAFEGADKIEELALRENNLNGQGLKHFRKSTASLKSLFLGNNKIVDEHLTAFEGADKIEVLHLGKNNLIGSGLKNFKESASSLKDLSLNENQITDEYLSVFENADKIVELQLWKNSLIGQGLRYFKKSIKTLEILGIGYNKITDEHLAVFNDADKIKVLQLMQNNFTGVGLGYFKKSAFSIKILELNTNPITDEYLETFNVSTLIVLALNNTKISLLGLKHFEQSMHSLEVLYLPKINLKSYNFLLKIPNLKEVYLKECSNVSLVIIEQLKQKGVEVVIDEPTSSPPTPSA